MTMMKKLITLLIIGVTAIMVDMPIEARFIARFALSNCIFPALFTAERCLFTTVNFLFDPHQSSLSFSKNMTSLYKLVGEIGRSDGGGFAMLIVEDRDDGWSFNPSKARWHLWAP